MLARLAFMIRAYSARVGPLETISIMPMLSFRMSDPSKSSDRGKPSEHAFAGHRAIFPAPRLSNIAHLTALCREGVLFLIPQQNIEQRTVNLQPVLVVDEAHLAESIHEEADPG